MQTTVLEVSSPRIEKEIGMPKQSDYDRLAERVTKAEQKISNTDNLVRALASRGKELATSVHNLELAVSEIRTELRIWNRIIGGCAGAAVLVGLGALSWCNSLGNRVTAISQKVLDGGNASLVAQLKKPTSPAQLQANLATVSAQIQTAQVEGVKPDQQKVSALSGALSEVVKDNPDSPLAWRAAAQLVNYKFQPQVVRTDESKNCLDVHPNQHPDAIPPSEVGSVVIELGNCVIDLDDDGNFYSTAVGKAILTEKAGVPNTVHFSLRLVNAVIRYSGGRVLPVAMIQFQNCSMELVPPTGVPTKNSQSITTQLLAAADPAKGSIQLPSA